MSGVHSAEELGELAEKLWAIEEWLRESSAARHSDDMADVVEKAACVVESLYDAQIEAEGG